MAEWHDIPATAPSGSDFAALVWLVVMCLVVLAVVIRNLQRRVAKLEKADG